jgi:uncharacterized protein YjbI with pentapeptide repeats
MRNVSTSSRQRITRLKRNVAPVVVALAVAIVFLLLWFVPPWEVRHIRGLSDQSLAFQQALDFADLVNKYRATWAQAIAGLALLSGLWFTWQNLRVSRDEKIAVRFSKAVEHLGDPRLAVRLGGVFGLERIARDSRRDHFTMVETLTAYVRENAPYREPRQQRENIPIDVQASLTVIGRRERIYEAGTDFTVDLSRTDLMRADLSEAHLEGANLFAAHLEEAILERVHLERGRLNDAHLEKAYLVEAHLDWAQLFGSYLQEAFLVGARLEWANLSTARLEGAILSRARMRGANLIEAHLDEALLDDAHLDGAVLTRAHLQRANLSGAHLDGADLSGAHLEGAIFSGADLEGADLTGAHLEGTVFQSANLRGVVGFTQAQLSHTSVAGTTLSPPAVPETGG